MAKHRKRGDGSIHLRKDGRWEGRYVISRDEKGFPVTRNVLAKTRAECAAKLEQLRESLQEPVNNQPKPGVLLRDWLNLWYQGYKKANLRPNTQMSYERRIYQHIIPALGGIQLDKLTTGDIQKFYTNLKKGGRLLRAELYGEGLSDQTVRGIHTTLHAALNKAVEEKLICRNPSDGCKLPSSKPREMKVLTPEEIQRLLIQAREDGCYELLLLELSTGLRRGEICALKWDDLNLKTGTLKVERQVHRVNGELVVSQPKTKASNRSIILPPPVLAVLKAYKKSATTQWMFPSPVKEDSPQDPTAVRKRLSTILKRAECKHIRFHDLRHTFATASLEHGMDVKTLSTIIGHVSSSTTLNIYAHVTDEMIWALVRKPQRQKREILLGNLPPAPFSPTKASGASPAPAASAKSTTISGRADTPPSSTAGAWPGTSMPKLRQNARKSWRNLSARSRRKTQQRKQAKKHQASGGHTPEA